MPCEICSDEPARYVCSNCTRRVGPDCFRTEGWLCAECSKKEANTIPAETVRIGRSIGSTLLVIAFLMIFGGLILLVVSAAFAGQNGVVLIFPFFYASSNGSGFLMLPAIAVIAIMLILAFFSLRRGSEK